MSYIEILVFYTVFLSSDAAIFCCLFCADAIRGWRLISLAFNFLGKLENINDDWIRHIRAIQ